MHGTGACFLCAVPEIELSVNGPLIVIKFKTTFRQAIESFNTRLKKAIFV